MEVAVLQLESNVSPTAEATLDAGGGDMDQVVTMELELEGELAWALEAGRLHGLELAGEVTSVTMNTSEFGGAEEPMEFVQTMPFEGEVADSLSVAPE